MDLRLNRGVVGVLSALVVAAIIVLPASAQDTALPCPVGEPPALDPDIIRTGVHPVTEPFLTACPTLRHQGRVELVAYREGRSLRGSSLCIDTYFSNGGSSGTCADADRRLHGLADFSFSVNPGWLYIGNFAGPGVAKIRLRYRSFGKTRRPRAILTRVSDDALLAKLALKRTFLFYSAEASLKGDYGLVLARNSSGRLISWRSFPLKELLEP